MSHFSVRLASIVSIVSLLAPSFTHAATVLYVTNQSDDSLSIFNTANRSLIDTVGVGNSPTDIVINGTGAYIVNRSDAEVSIIDITDNQLVREIPVNDSPQFIAVSGTGIYVLHTAMIGSPSMLVIDSTNYEEEKEISVDDSPQGLAISGTGVYVVSYDTENVTVYDLTDGMEEVAEISIGNAPQDIAINGTGAYVVNADDANVSVIDITDNQVVTTFSVGASPRDIAINGTGAYVTNAGGQSISVIDITDFQTVTTIALGKLPTDIVISGTGAYALLPNNDQVSVIDIANNQIEATLTVGDFPTALAFGTDTTTLAPTLTIPSNVEVCENLTVEYTLPEVPTTGTVQIQFYHILSHLSTTLTLNDDEDVSFVFDTQNIVTSSNILSIAGPTSLAEGNYAVYLTYQDAYGNTAGEFEGDLFVAYCQPVSSSSVSTGGGGGGSGGGRPTITPEYVREVSKKRFGSSSSSSSTRPEFVEINGQTFTDVRTDTWYATFVKKIAELKIFEGYKTVDGTPLNKFGPADSITLGQLAKVGTILWDKKDSEPKPAGDEWFKPYISKVQQLQLSVFDGSPNALASATRGQVVQTIIEALNYTIKQGTPTYDDVPADHPYAQAIVTASGLGFIGGDTGTNNFRPDEPINRAEVAKILSLALGHVGINYLDDMLSASPTSSSSAAASSSASSVSSSVTSEALKSAAGKDIRHVITPNAHVRSDARINSAILWTARFGQEFEVLRIVAGTWAHVRVSDGNEGYVWTASLAK